MKLCPQCYNENKDEVHFCPGCGTDLDFSPTGSHSTPRFSTRSWVKHLRRFTTGPVSRSYQVVNVAESMTRRETIKMIGEERLASHALWSDWVQSVSTSNMPSHPGIVPATGQWKDRWTGGGPVQRTTHVEIGWPVGCESLTQRLERPVSPSDALLIARDLANALTHAHANGRLHGNLKPSNVLLPTAETSIQKAMICDFGAQHLLEASGNVGEAFTTLAPYMSPEQCSSGLPVDEYSDMYSLGALLYTICSERPLFEGALAEILDAQQHQSPKPLPTSVPAPLRTLVDALLQKEPRHRPSASEAVMTIGDMWKSLAPDDNVVSIQASPMVGEYRLAKARTDVYIPSDSRMKAHLLGQVYVAEHARDRFVAQVVILKETRLLPSVQQFFAISLAASDLSHPHIQKVYTAKHLGGVNYVAAEPLAEPPLGAQHASYWCKAMKELALGLEALHRAGIVHGAVGGKSIGFVARPEQSNLCAVLSNAGAGELLGLQEDGGPVSPEHFHGQPYTPLSDLYCLGNTILRKITGNTFYVGMLTARKFRKPRRPSNLCHHTSLEFDALMLRLLQEEPSERYQSARELVEDIVKLPEMRSH